MRYQNWDVLLFPGNSRIPIQEFGTACHIISDPNNLAASKWAPGEESTVLSRFESLTKTPILTCFISSLPSSTSFRVSIHSWNRPGPSTILKARRATDEAVAFQVRVYVDGIAQSTRTFREGTAWPEVIDIRGRPQNPLSSTSTNLPDGRSYEPDTDLMFPAFHPEILQQPRWDPAEPLGRIQIVLSEGVLREARAPHTNSTKVAFDALRDVVAFAFQHAPQDVLEYSGIAWPNARLFENKSTVAGRQPILNTRTTSTPGPEAHAHSPQRAAGGNRDDVWGRIASRAEQGLANYHYRGERALDSTGSRKLSMTPMAQALTGANDPFIAPGPSSIGWKSSARKISTDDSMPDYASHSTDHSRAGTDMSVSWPRRDFQKHMDEAAIEEIVQALSSAKKGQLLTALSPEKSSSSGIQPPINSPSIEVADLNDHSDQRTPREGLLGPIAGNAKFDNARGVSTRAMKMQASDVLQGERVAFAKQRGRSSSGSSKRKRSPSHESAAGPPYTRKSRVFDVTPPAGATLEKRSVLIVNDSSSESDSDNKPKSRVSSVEGVSVSSHQC